MRFDAIFDGLPTKLSLPLVMGSISKHEFSFPSRDHGIQTRQSLHLVEIFQSMPNNSIISPFYVDRTITLTGCPRLPNLKADHKVNLTSIIQLSNGFTID